MKQAKFKTCRDENCETQFKPFLSTQKYCSSSCAYKNKKPDKPRQAIRQKSKKQSNLDRAYSVLRKSFIEEHKYKRCPVALNILNKSLAVIEVHHKAGRVGKLYLDVSKWLAVSREGHIWIHENPEEAYKLNFLIKSTTV
jgi:hypothetical protein